MIARIAAKITLLGLGLGLLSGLDACSSKPKPLPIIDGDWGAGHCSVNSDCADPLVCAFERCHEECVTTRDCDGTLRCVGAHEAKRVCQLAIEAKCKTTVDCLDGFICGQDGACRDSCQVNGDCVGTQVCVRGVCAEPTELDDAGELPQKLSFESCGSDADCAQGQRCLSRTCQPECRQDRDCSNGETCVDGACRTGDASVTQCAQDADCSKAGQSCVNGGCRCACQQDIDCKSGETCDGCACKALPAPECAWDLDCAVGKRCIEGACACECLQDRDCAAGQACDGCSCQTAPQPTTIHDATIRGATDLQLMRGIEEVEGTLTISGNLANTAGLESLHKVGNLKLDNWALQYGDKLPEPLAGLANLTEITDTLTILSTQLTALSFNSKLKVGSAVVMQYVPLSCTDVDVFKTTIGFQGTFSVSNAGNCSGACSMGVCWPLP